MKKIFAAILTAALVFSPVGTTIFQDQVSTVEAKSYKSGKKGVNFNKSTTNNNNQSNVQNNQQQKNNTATNQQQRIMVVSFLAD